MAKIEVEGYNNFNTAVSENQGKTVFALFTGSHDANGRSWCPDCVAADPVIEASLSKLPMDSVFIKCSVGDRAYWKNQQNDFRIDPKLRLKSVPTLLKLGEPQRLEEEQCAKSDLVEMVFSED
ncbi:Thioredoxin domain-containing protein 17 [Mactra antiquata]